MSSLADFVNGHAGIEAGLQTLEDGAVAKSRSQRVGENHVKRHHKKQQKWQPKPTESRKRRDPLSEKFGLGSDDDDSNPGKGEPELMEPSPLPSAPRHRCGMGGSHRDRKPVARTRPGSGGRGGTRAGKAKGAVNSSLADTVSRLQGELDAGRDKLFELMDKLDKPKVQEPCPPVPSPEVPVDHSRTVGRTITRYHPGEEKTTALVVTLFTYFMLMCLESAFFLTLYMDSRDPMVTKMCGTCWASITAYLYFTMRRVVKNKTDVRPKRWEIKFQTRYSGMIPTDGRPDPLALNAVKHVDPFYVDASITTFGHWTDFRWWSPVRYFMYVVSCIWPDAVVSQRINRLVSIELLTQILSQPVANFASTEETNWHRINQSLRSLHTVNEDRTLVMDEQPVRQITAIVANMMFEKFRQDIDHLPFPKPK